MSGINYRQETEKLSKLSYETMRIVLSSGNLSIGIPDLNGRLVSNCIISFSTDSKRIHGRYDCIRSFRLGDYQVDGNVCLALMLSESPERQDRLMNHGMVPIPIPEPGYLIPENATIDLVSEGITSQISVYLTLVNGIDEKPTTRRYTSTIKKVTDDSPTTEIELKVDWVDQIMFFCRGEDGNIAPTETLSVQSQSIILRAGNPYPWISIDGQPLLLKGDEVVMVTRYDEEKQKNTLVI